MNKVITIDDQIDIISKLEYEDYKLKQVLAGIKDEKNILSGKEEIQNSKLIESQRSLADAYEKLKSIIASGVKI